MKTKNSHYVYKITDRVTREFYYGSRTCKGNPMDDKYMGSPCRWKPIKDNLIKEIVKKDFKNREEAIKFESELIKENIKDSLNRNYYIPNKGHYMLGANHSKDTKKRISKFMSENHPLKGKHHTDETRKKMSESLSGRKLSDETRKKMSEVKKGIPTWNKGLPCSEETKEKLRISCKGINSGRKLSEEHKRKISDSIKKRNKNE